RPADALAPESVRQQLADLEARGALPLAAFREAQESAERLQVWGYGSLFSSGSENFIMHLTLGMIFWAFLSATINESCGIFNESAS
ncbi:hypothetical protein MJN85_27525, partial [Salmonella enterica subsp. enterica serovar Anatum]|nr:hypothetical protein [Salmonella enterica subsp. enterica serovar Anatum]